MNDLISRKAAIDKFKSWLSVKGYSEGELNMLKAVLYELRCLPAAEPVNYGSTKSDSSSQLKLNNDYISRQAAIDEVAKWFYDVFGIKESDGTATIFKRLRDIPSAQPEIIRCKECKHSDHWYRDKARCFLWHETGIDVFEDGFCNYAERKDRGI